MSDTRIGFVIGTFLPFHKGHEALISFANGYLESLSMIDFNESKLSVVVSSRSREPIDGKLRYNSVSNFVSKIGCTGEVYHHDDDDAPQNPVGDDDVEFWKYWKDIIIKSSGCGNESEFLETYGNNVYFFSSESYGEKLAELFGGKHVYFDHQREVNHISGTKIRQDPFYYADQINDSLRLAMTKNYVFFGAESVGKTTMTRIMGDKFKSLTYPEYARPYLMRQEDKSPSLDNMVNIFHGQIALERTAENVNIGNLVNFYDTDIMSTIGYMKMIGMDYKGYINYVKKSFLREKYYIILAQDEVPYEHDVLRYGNGVRESDDQFWIDLLEKFNLPYTVIRGVGIQERVNKVSDLVKKDVESLFSFDRE